MAFSNGPRIVTDGLVFAADAGNKQCYIGSGTTGYDLIEDIALTLTNDTTLNSSFGGIWEMDGSGDHINCDGGGNRNPSSIVTICQWVKFDTLGNYDGIFGKRIGSSVTMPFLMSLDNTSKIRFRTAQSDNTNKEVYTNSAISADTWYYAVGVADGSNIKLYLDSVLQTDTTSYNGTLKQDSGEELRIGFNYSTELDGLAGPSQMYSKALTQSEVTQNYNAQKSRFGK